MMEVAQQIPEAFAEVSLEWCYQCGKCTAGCPMAGQMDLMPNQVLRLVQSGEMDKALRSQAIWLCVSCFTCTARCPQTVDCAGTMDVLRQMAAEQGKCSPQQQRIYLFQRAFLDNVRRNGRVNEAELIAWFKLQGFLKDFSVPLLLRGSMLGPKMLRRGKLHPFGEKTRNRAVVRRIFDRCAKHTLSASLRETAEHAT